MEERHKYFEFSYTVAYNKTMYILFEKGERASDDYSEEYRTISGIVIEPGKGFFVSVPAYFVASLYLLLYRNLSGGKVRRIYNFADSKLNHDYIRK
jgi:hypothetical protein